MGLFLSSQLFRSKMKILGIILLFLFPMWEGAGDILTTSIFGWQKEGLQYSAARLGRPVSGYVSNGAEYGVLRKTVSGPGTLRIGVGVSPGLSGAQKVKNYVVRMNGEAMTRISTDWFDDFIVPEGEHEIEFKIAKDDLKGLIYQFLYGQGYRLSIGDTDGGVGMVNGSVLSANYRERYFSPDEEITISAVPLSGYVFVGWEGDLSNREQSFKLKLDESFFIKPIFQKVRLYGRFQLRSYSGQFPLFDTSSGRHLWKYVMDDQTVERSSLVLFTKGPAWFYLENGGITGSSTGNVALKLDGDPLALPLGDEPLLLPYGDHTIEIVMDPELLTLYTDDGVTYVDVIVPTIVSANFNYTEWWQYHDATLVNDMSAIDPMNDFDDDGLSNYLEYRLARNPVVWDPYLEIGVDRVTQKVNLGYIKLQGEISAMLGLYYRDEFQVRADNEAYEGWQFFDGKETPDYSELYRQLFRTEIELSGEEKVKLFRYQYSGDVPSLETLLSQ